MPYGPGKFEGRGAETYALYLSSLVSGQDETAGTVEDIGWHGLFRGPWADVFEDTDTLGETYSAGYTEDEIDTARMALAGMAGAILYEDSQGFVESVLFATEDELSVAWGAIVAEDSEVEAAERFAAWR